jgi:hypothetical protein
MMRERQIPRRELGAVGKAQNRSSKALPLPLALCSLSHLPISNLRPWTGAEGLPWRHVETLLSKGREALLCKTARLSTTSDYVYLKADHRSPVLGHTMLSARFQQTAGLCCELHPAVHPTRPQQCWVPWGWLSLPIFLYFNFHPHEVKTLYTNCSIKWTFSNHFWTFCCYSDGDWFLLYH